ncbi:MAG TPA: homocysteine S-methyltransferase family protein [Gammaproteobacteria bacterium]|nr:homocysteine S-methyltransferase family protein [Gammaproteobacteria bacterium]
MARTESTLPQLDGGWFLTDGGIETVLIFQEGIALPEFAAFVLLQSAEGRDRLRNYFRPFLDVAARAPGAGFVLESPTWRAGFNWGAKLGFDGRRMRQFNRDAIALMRDLQVEYAARITRPIVVSGCVGPRGDGYVAGAPMALDDAARVHQPQVDALAAAGADLITAITMTTSAEAIGVARAAARAGRPAAISFTVETDGTLPSGESLRAAIGAVDDDAATAGHEPPAYYMLNCAHPCHFEHVLGSLGERRSRLRGLRANASRRSHAELDAATELDAGDARELGADYARLKAHWPSLTVLGGCCGTDHTHVAAMSTALLGG